MSRWLFSFHFGFVQHILLAKELEGSVRIKRTRILRWEKSFFVLYLMWKNRPLLLKLPLPIENARWQDRWGKISAFEIWLIELLAKAGYVTSQGGERLTLLADTPPESFKWLYKNLSSRLGNREAAAARSFPAVNPRGALMSAVLGSHRAEHEKNPPKKHPSAGWEQTGWGCKGGAIYNQRDWLLSGNNLALRRLWAGCFLI